MPLEMRTMRAIHAAASGDFRRLGNISYTCPRMGIWTPKNRRFPMGTRLAPVHRNNKMKAPSFIHRHYSPQRGESPTGHAAAMLVGALMIGLGVWLARTVVFLPLGIVIGLLGLFILGEGIFAHITSPLKLGDLMDAVVGLAGAAIAMTFALAVMGLLIAFGLGTAAALIEWLRNLS